MNELETGIWEKRHDVRLPGGIYFNSRMTVIDLGDGELFLHSPVPIDDTDQGRIEDLGEVRWIVAPNDLHHLYVSDTAARFPEAEVWGTPGAREKHPDLTFDGALEEDFPREWRGVEPLHVDGTRGWAETVFFMPQRRMLLCSDLVFNIHETVNRRTKWLLKLVGAHGTLAQSASVRWFLTKDRALVGDAFRRILSWDFDRVVMGHGEVVESGGREALFPLLDWAIEDRARLTA